MVKLSELLPASAKHLLDKDCPPFETAPFVLGPPLRERRVPAAIQPRPQSHRNGVRKTQNPDPKSRSPEL